MSNILFVLYHDFSANSAVHVHNFANQLARLGHDTAVATPKGDDTGAALGQQRYAIGLFDEIDGDWSDLFPNGAAPDIVHAWTPRENVRLFCEKIAGFSEFSLFVHLEDNEEMILEANMGEAFEELLESDREIPPNLSHPRHYREFIEAAAGVTVIMDQLKKFVSPGKPKLILWPGADRELFYPRPRDDDFLASLGVARGSTVFSYTGNVHTANARDVRSLYVAAAILDREGIPAVLLRTGRDFCDFLGPDHTWARKISIDLGHVDYGEIPNILSLADVLVQPGGDSAFNDYRLPGKLPEFFAMGRPIILPLTNVGRFVRHGEDAWVLPKVDALGIVDAVETLRSDDRLRQRLSSGAVEFCRQHFDWETNTANLDQFYRDVVARTQAKPDATAAQISA